MEWLIELKNNKVTVKHQINFDSDKVFIVHGQDKEILETTARFIEKIKLKPIILHEQPNKGKTIIEKFENYSDVAFAIVLLTPDDTCLEKGIEIKRARQNVVFELGYFIGKIGRDRVIALYKETVEIPSDYSGVLYIPYDKNGNWKVLVAKEFKTLGLRIDLNDIV